MNCPYCQEKTEVLATRKYKDYPDWNLRIRKCHPCEHTFRTLEMTIEEFQQALATPTADPNLITFDT